MFVTDGQWCPFDAKISAITMMTWAGLTISAIPRQNEPRGLKNLTGNIKWEYNIIVDNLITTRFVYYDRAALVWTTLRKIIDFPDCPLINRRLAFHKCSVGITCRTCFNDLTNQMFNVGNSVNQGINVITYIRFPHTDVIYNSFNSFRSVRARKT